LGIAAPAKKGKAKAAKPIVVKKKLMAYVVPVGVKNPKPYFKRPLHYGGGKIYYSKSKGAWRVYLRHPDKVEVTVKVDADDPDNVKKQWKKCLKAINQDPRPVLA